MKTKADYLEANSRLATLFGWTKIVDVGGALLGKPDWVCDNSRDQVQVPDWCGQWSACGPLLTQLSIWLSVAPTGVAIAAKTGDPGMVWYDDHSNPDAALRYAIVLAAVGKLGKCPASQTLTKDRP